MDTTPGRNIAVLARERGAAAEYSLLVGFIPLVIAAGVGAYGLALNGFIEGPATSVKTALGVHQSLRTT